MKAAVIITLCILVLLTDAEKVVDDTNSSDSPQMPAKLEELTMKSMVATKSARRNTREAINESTSDSNLQSGVITYVRWGNSDCPPGADMIYSGAVGGSWYSYEGSAVNLLCLPPDPQYLQYQAGYQGVARLYGAEYQVNGPINQANDRNVPCALCEVMGRTNKIMIPSRYECPSGWRREYYGYLMAGTHNQRAATQYTCMDESLEQIPGSASDGNGYLLYTVEAYCGHFIPCSDKELTCVVCTK